MRQSARRVAFLVAAAFMLLAPAYVQVFGGAQNSLPTWRMFHLRGNGTCSVRYYDRGKRVDRYALAGLTRRNAPDSFRKISGVDQARAMGRQLCDLIGDGADVRVELRCADLDGFHGVLDREEDLCSQ